MRLFKLSALIAGAIILLAAVGFAVFADYASSYKAAPQGTVTIYEKGKGAWPVDIKAQAKHSNAWYMVRIAWPGMKPGAYDLTDISLSHEGFGYATKDGACDIDGHTASVTACAARGDGTGASPFRIGHNMQADWVQGQLTTHLDPVAENTVNGGLSLSVRPEVWLKAVDAQISNNQRWVNYHFYDGSTHHEFTITSVQDMPALAKK